MIDFLQPGWMYAAAGIALPVAVHLWNVRRGKVLKVGSVALLLQQTTKNTSSIQLHQLLLLVLRCMLMVLLALLLAKPLWVGNSRYAAGWVLLDKNDVPQTYRYYKTKVDSLLQAGCELHYFNPGFEKTDINTATNTKGDAARHDNYWHTVRQLLAVAGTQRPLYIFSSSYLHNFNGIRPAMPPTVHWLLYTPADTAAFTSSAFENAAGGITTITTRTSAAGSNNIYADIPGSEAKKITGITPDTATLRVSMYASAGIADAAYIKAAIAAIQQYSNRKITFTACSSPSLLPAKQNWLFWLSTDDPPAGIQANNILRYQKGREEDIQSSLLTAGNPSLYKRIIPAETNTINNIVWADGFGNPILQKEAGPQNTYHFYSRFNTVWTDLVWSNEFTNVLYKLLYGEDATPAAQGFKDLRMADSNQLSPYITVKPITAAKNGAKDISWLFWLAAFIVLSAERMIALTPKKRGAHA